MRIVSVVLCLAFATACGMSKEDHQRALDQQRKELTATSDKTITELKTKLTDAEAALKKAQEEQTTSSVKNKEALDLAQKRIKILSAALNARTAQVAWINKAVADAERLVRAAYDEAKAAGASSSRMLSEAFDLVQQKKPAAGQKIQDAADALAKEAM